MLRILFPIIFLTTLIQCTPRPNPPAVAAGNAVGIVGSRIITDLEFSSEIQKIEKEFPRKFSTHPQKMSLLKEVMNVEILSQEAMRLGIDQSFEFKARLADLYIKKISAEARATISDADIEKLYAENKRDLDQVSARHILFKDKKRMKELEALRSELIKSPEAFAEAAKTKSNDGSAANGGELGFFSYPMMVPPFSDAAFKLQKINDISPVIESSFGLHIIQLTGDRRGLEFSKEKVKNELLRRSQSNRLNEEIERLKAGIKFEIFEKNLMNMSSLPETVNQDPEKVIQWNQPDKESDKP